MFDCETTVGWASHCGSEEKEGTNSGVGARSGWGSGMRSRRVGQYGSAISRRARWAHSYREARVGLGIERARGVRRLWRLRSAERLSGTLRRRPCACWEWQERPLGRPRRLRLRAFSFFCHCLTSLFPWVLSLLWEAQEQKRQVWQERGERRAWAGRNERTRKPLRLDCTIPGRGFFRKSEARRPLTARPHACGPRPSPKRGPCRHTEAQTPVRSDSRRKGNDGRVSSVMFLLASLS